MMCDTNESSNNSYAIQWDASLVQFKDPVYGYIGIPKTYATHLIDTPHVQRLKSVAQSGIRPLFSSATHDRFSHSLGVYKFANMAYKSLRASILSHSRKHHALNFDQRQRISENLESWGNLLSIAAIIHDIGHPAGSHSFEFLYDDIFLHLDSPAIDLTTYEGWKSQWEHNKAIYIDYLTQKKYSYSDSKLKQELKNELLKNNHEELSGNPHERMSAYILLKDSSLRQKIEGIIKAHWREFRHNRDEDGRVDDAIEFICRMILGQEYPCTYTAEFDLENYENSMKNCTIRLINGVLDADSMDYIMRNSYSAGYATHKVDYDRLCTAFSIIENQNMLEPCFTKSALSVIEGFIVARNFEPKWLYSHHKVVYYDVLLKSLYHYAVKYLCFCNYHDYKDKFAQELKTPTDRHGELESVNEQISAADELAKALAADHDSQNFDEQQLDYPMSDWPYPYYTYILSPVRSFSSKNAHFHATVDADIESLFKTCHLKLKKSNLGDEYEGNKIFNSYDKEIFSILLEEYENRKLKKSLWKSYAEYMLLIKEVSACLGVPNVLIHSYMMDLIRNGLERWSFGMQQYDSKINDFGATRKFPNTYEEQYIYRPYPSQEDLKDEEFSDIARFFARNNAKDVFGYFDGQYNFSHKYCSCKIYKARYKNFDKIKIKFDDKAYKIVNIIDIPNESKLEFPYIFFSTTDDTRLNADIAVVRNHFIQRFKDYCAEKIKYDQGTDRRHAMASTVTKQHTIRDVVHGDITFTDAYWDVINAKEFQRLRRIKQLATAAQVFPNAVHTRFAHAIGTYHIMKMIVEHFQHIFSDLCIEPTDAQDAPIALLAALLHDIGHGPFSHAFESVAQNAIRHEDWAEKIILDASTEVHQRIVDNFGKDAPEKVVDCIKNKDREDNGLLNFSMIYSGLVNGPLDADRMDYLLRDAYNTSAQFGFIDIQKIIASMKIAQIDGTYCVCFDEHYLSYIEQLIFARYQMYDNIYFESYKVLSESLVQCILQRAYDKRNVLQEKSKKFLETIFDAHITTEDFLNLDDHVISYYFQQWKDDNRDSILSEMCHALIDRTSYQEVHVEEYSEVNFSGILKKIGAICDFDIDQMISKKSRKNFGFIQETRFTSAYPAKKNSRDKDINKTIWIMKGNGLVCDFRDTTRLHNKNDEHFWKIYKSYLYYSPSVMRFELENQNKTRQAEGKAPLDIDKKIKEIESLMNRYTPRSHIEIEEKYQCDCDTLKQIETMLIKEKDVFSPYKLKDGFETVSQEDTYYDTEDRILEKKECSLRIRKIGKKYTCTIKLPADGDNFGGNSQFARFEYEEASDSGALKGFANFINMRLKIKGLPIIKDAITSENINEIFKPVITILNSRKKASITRDKEHDNFLCEICLDTVIYQKESTAKEDWQVEIELKSDFLHHIVLKIFTDKLEMKCAGKLHREEKSKYLRGLSLLSI